MALRGQGAVEQRGAPASRRKATTRDPDEWRRATEAAREQRQQTAAEVADVIREQVFELIVEGDVMGGRALFAQRIQSIVRAERGDDAGALRAALMDGAVALGAWVAAMDYRPPSMYANGSSAEA